MSQNSISATKETLKEKNIADATELMSARDKFKTLTFIAAVDNLGACLQKRADAYSSVLEIFECLLALSETHADR